MLVVQRDSVPDAGAPLPPLQPVDRPAESALACGRKGDRLESRQLPTCADFLTDFDGRMRPRGGGLPGGFGSQKVHAQMNGGIEQAQRLTQVRGAAAVGLYPFFSFSFSSCPLFLSFNFHCSVAMKGSGGELRHLASSPGGRGGYSDPVILS
jgi:hypothetical protein